MKVPATKQEENTKVVDAQETLDTQEPLDDSMLFLSLAERNPSNWNVLPVEENDICTFTNTVTGRVVEGTVADFNELLQVSLSYME